MSVINEPTTVAVAVRRENKTWQVRWMNVQIFDGLTRFHVTSIRPGAKANLVDLSSLWGNGQCSCRDFSVRRMKKINEWTPSTRNPSDETRCFHIMGARVLLGLTIVDGYLAKLKLKED